MYSYIYPGPGSFPSGPSGPVEKSVGFKMAAGIFTIERKERRYRKRVKIRDPLILGNEAKQVF